MFMKNEVVFSKVVCSMLICFDVGYVMFDYNGWYLYLWVREVVLFFVWEELKMIVVLNSVFDYLIGVLKLF